MPKRHDNAIFIQAGASNPSGVAIALVDAIREARDEGKDTAGIKSDPACRMICHQLAYLMGVDRIDAVDAADGDVYSVLMKEIAKHATPETLKSCRMEHLIEEHLRRAAETPIA